jgi:hypothetical protein
MLLLDSVDWPPEEPLELAMGYIKLYKRFWCVCTSFLSEEFNAFYERGTSEKARQICHPESSADLRLYSTEPHWKHYMMRVYQGEGPTFWTDRSISTVWLCQWKFSGSMSPLCTTLLTLQNPMRQIVRQTSLVTANVGYEWILIGGREQAVERETCQLCTCRP